MSQRRTSSSVPIVEIDKELDEREAQFLAEGKAVEAQRIRQRTRYDIEMLRELGYCTASRTIPGVISGGPSARRR